MDYSVLVTESVLYDTMCARHVSAYCDGLNNLRE